MGIRWLRSIIETADMPEAVQKKLATTGVELWQAEAARIWERERVRHQEALMAERDLRNEILGMLDARDLVIEGQRKEISRYVADLERMAAKLERLKEHLQAVRADDFWERVVQEIHAVLPERHWMHVRDITRRIGADLVQKARSHKEP